MNLFSLAGKKAIVTGATRGLGRSMAEGLLEAGCEVVMIGSSESTYEVVKYYKDKGFLAHAVQADLADHEDLNKAFDYCLELLKDHLDILVNCAGIQRRNKAEDFTIKDWNDVININLSSVFLLCQLAGRKMLAQKKGKIINVASMLSFFGGFTVSAYASSKGGVAQLTKALSNEWAREGININAIAPGYMETELNAKLINDPQRYADILARIPAQRWGKPEDMKGITVFLASEASNYLNGAVIPVDGGYLGC